MEQLEVLGSIEDECHGDGARKLEHPRHPAYLAAFRCFIAASAVAAALDVDPFEAATECAYRLDSGIRIDRPTILAIADRTLAPA